MDATSRLAAGAQHKRKGSALDQLNDGQDLHSGKAARSAEAEAQQEAAAAEEQQRQEQEAKVRALAHPASSWMPLRRAGP